MAEIDESDNESMSMREGSTNLNQKQTLSKGRLLNRDSKIYGEDEDVEYEWRKVPLNEYSVESKLVVK